MGDTVDAGSPGSGALPALRRDLWRQVRQQTNEYEQKVAELQLDRQQHEKALKAKKEELEKVRAATAHAERDTISINRRTMELQREQLAIQREVQDTMDDHKQLLEQIQVARQRLEQLKKDRQQMNEAFQEHLDEQRAIVEQYTEHHQATAAAEATQQ